MRQFLPMRNQQSMLSARQAKPTVTATQRNAVTGASRAKSGSPRGGPTGIAAMYGRIIHAATSGTQMSHMNCSTRWTGTMPESLRVRRRTRTIMAPTQPQYAQTVAANAMQGRSLIDIA